MKLRAYNVFLQGQFRGSALTYEYKQLRPVVFEMWLGYNHELSNGYYVNYSLRGHTSEIKDGAGDRNMIWGGVVVGRKLF